MYSATHLEVKLRRQEQLREAEYRRWTATVRRTDRRSTRIARAFGLATSATR